MKILTKEQAQAHYNAVIRGGLSGGLITLTVGLASACIANHRYHAFRSLTLPYKAFLVTYSSTFVAIVQADRASRSFQSLEYPDSHYVDKTERLIEEARGQEGTMRRAKDWVKENRYPIIGTSWVASMAVALGLMRPNQYLSGSQKLVQARMAAQGFTLAVLIATAALEVRDAKMGEGKYEKIMVFDPNDPVHKRMIEKMVHHETYPGEDTWKGNSSFGKSSV